MAIILHIDTAVETASICLAEEVKVLGFETNELPKEHSSWLHPAIKRLFQSAGKSLDQLDAVAVTIGPGSYTGLRVGLSAAKGLCYSLDKPLITINTLELMAGAVTASEADFLIPVIDARRMEVFTAVFDSNLRELEKPHALVVDESSFGAYLAKGKILVTGNAVNKLRDRIRHDNVLFSEEMPDARDMTRFSFRRFAEKIFSDLAYTEPLYVKEFYQPNH